MLGRLQQGGRHDVGVLLKHEQRADGLRRDVPVPQVYGLAEPGHGMAVGEVGDALQVAQWIFRIDHQRGIVLPLIRIPKPHVQRPQLRQRACPGLRRHPRRGLDALHDRRADVVGDTLDARLLLRGK